MTSGQTRREGGAAVHPRLNGIHHVGITATDLDTSVAWYQRVLGLGRAFEEQHFNSAAGGHVVVLGPPDLSFSLGIDHHPENSGERFDCRRTGLDHLSFQVGDVDELAAWAAHLDEQGVENSGVYAMAGFPISLVTFCDPDGVQLELIAFHV